MTGETAHISKNKIIGPPYYYSVTISLSGKCPYSEIFWSLFSRIWTEYEEILRIYEPERLRIRTLFKQCLYQEVFLYHLSSLERFIFFLRHFCDDINNNYFSALNQIKLTHFMPLISLIPLKTSENHRFSDVSRGYQKRSVAWNGLKELWVCNHSFSLKNHNRVESLIFRLDWYLRWDMALF